MLSVQVYSSEECEGNIEDKKVMEDGNNTKENMVSCLDDVKEEEDDVEADDLFDESSVPSIRKMRSSKNRAVRKQASIKLVQVRQLSTGGQLEESVDNYSDVKQRKNSINTHLRKKSMSFRALDAVIKSVKADIIDDEEYTELKDEFNFYCFPDSTFGYAAFHLMLPLTRPDYDIKTKDLSFLDFHVLKDQYRDASINCLNKSFLAFFLCTMDCIKVLFVLGPAALTFCIQGFILHQIFYSLQDYEESGLCRLSILLQFCVLSIFFADFVSCLFDTWSELYSIRYSTLVVSSEEDSTRYSVELKTGFQANLIRSISIFIAISEFVIVVLVIIVGTKLILISTDPLTIVSNAVAINFVNYVTIKHLLVYIFFSILLTNTSKPIHISDRHNVLPCCIFCTTTT
jgi:hypothetical protein